MDYKVGDKVEYIPDIPASGMRIGQSGVVRNTFVDQTDIGRIDIQWEDGGIDRGIHVALVRRVTLHPARRGPDPSKA